MSFSRSSANDKLLSWYTNLNARSWTLLMRLLSSLLWNIQIKGQYLNWDVTKAFIKHLHLLRSTWFTILEFGIYFYTRTFSLLLLFIKNFSIFAKTALLVVTNRWLLSALAFMWFSWNHLKRLFVHASNLLITLSRLKLLQ